MSSATSSMSNHNPDSSSSNAAGPLYQVKLLSALRNGNPALIHPFLAEIGKDRRKSVDSDIDTGAAALHLAIRCGSVETVNILLSHRTISPNGVHPPSSGTTALHLAASLGRVDVVNLLLEQEGIDDTLRDADGQTCRNVAKGKETLKAIDDSRSFLNASFRSLLRTYILSPLSSPPSSALLSLLESPRVRFVNLSYLDDDSGSSLLHEAAKRKDLRLIELAVRAGADVFVRDRKGKMAYEGSGKDDRVRVFLRQYANHDTTLIEAPSSEPPSLKGYLHKYTNVARGYNTRWIVLKGGVLSYYRHQEDEDVASRGSISMKTAILKTNSAEKLRFEVQSTPSRGHQSGIQKWYLKANHPVEASRWIQAISKSIEHYKRSDGDRRRRSADSDQSGMKSLSSHRGIVSSMIMRRSTTMRATGSAGASASSFTDLGGTSGGSPEFDTVNGNGNSSPIAMESGVEDDEREGDTSDAESTKRNPPFDDTFDLHGNSAAAQMELTAQLLTNLALPLNVPQRTIELKTALQESFATVQGMLDEYAGMVKEREAWWKKKLEKEQQRQSMWEESFAMVVKEGELLERELRTRSRKRGSRFFDASFGSADGMGTVKQRPSQFSHRSPGIMEEKWLSDRDLYTIAASGTDLGVDSSQQVRSPTLQEIAPSASSMISAKAPLQTKSAPPEAEDKDSFVDTDEEDEFFDAIESNTLPNLVINSSLTSPKPFEHSRALDFNIEPYAGYRNLRSELGNTDERPSTSLWSVLKHSIGKDLTKISFPVFFNEPTSMLQRMAEDMEFSECLDIAARETDAHKRIAFVAAFAMSNYSSTIGRIAKPFNPMLSETFEYVRLDKEYRYISEQVSHHPPISACWAESPMWRYYGEVDAQNKFMGKSFEIRPTGIAHAELLLPEGLVPNYPKGNGKIAEGKAIEHYSWKKVTTNVSGFILGSPTIDHYGEMTITNHQTQDQCVLTFKPRGWRGKDAFEISGHVRDARGNITYEIAGRWNSQLIARAVGTGSGFLHPDVAVTGGASSPSIAPEYILLWRNSEKPPAPFNLTPFAITLNDCPEDTLKPYLCPTDCRLRVDQRAFERGKYELANELKNEQEEFQRATRKAREEGRVPPHQPRWFSAQTDQDSGERVWAPVRVGDEVEYWVERERVWRTGGNSEWTRVEPIFIEEQRV